MLTTRQRDEHQRWLEVLTGIPTAPGRENRVIEWVAGWARRRRNLELRRDGSGNLLITVRGAGPPPRPAPLLVTAHMDHPAFVVRRVLDRHDVELEFRGGVHDPYFADAGIEIFDGGGARHTGRIVRFDHAAEPFKIVTCRLGRAADLQPGDIGRFDYGGRGSVPVVSQGRLYAPACDDLAGVAAALSALDVLRGRRAGSGTGVLLTRAEEIGFIGAIAACKKRTVPRRARLICLESSRSYPESPIGAGPILRVGDKLTVFSPRLTNVLGLLLADHQKRHPGFKAQRKLMPGGTCEASTFSAYGYESACVCLPMGNYHNMEDIDGVQTGRAPARTGPECISLDDFHGMVELLVHFAQRLDSAGTEPIRVGMEQRYRRHRGVLAQGKAQG